MQIPYDWDRVEAFLKLLDGPDYIRCIGGKADDMSREMLYVAYRR